MSPVTFVETALREFRLAFRMMGRNPAFSITVVLTLALGIGATTAIFSVVNAVVIKPLPYPDSEAVVTVTHSAVFGNVRGNNFPFSAQMLETYSTNGQAFEELGLVGGGQAAVTGMGDPEITSRLLVTAGTLRVLALQPLHGRWFSNADDQPGAAETAILSNGYWQRRFGGDPGVIGRVITVDGRPREVIGVMPAHFEPTQQPADLILPLQIDLANPPADFNYNAVARLKPGITVAAANADLGRMLPMYLSRYMGDRMDALQLQPAIRPLKQDIVGNVGQILWVLLGSISILLLIVCANVANLLLVRTETRATELAVRTALGAGSMRLARGLMAESLALGLIGGLLGVALAYGGLRVLLALGPASLPRLNEITIDLAVIVFAAATSVAAGLIFGLVPMLRLVGRRFSSNLATFLRGGGRGASAGKGQHQSQNALVVIQVALALVMLVSSGLMIRTFQNLRSVEPGFTDPATIQTVRVTMPDTMNAEPERAVRMQQQIREQMAAIPGVASVAYIDEVPMEGQISALVTPEDKTYGPGELAPTRRIKWISPGLFQTLGTPLLAGRDFEWVELENQRNVALVSAGFARETWNTVEGALGKRIRVGVGGPFQEVIGVVADVYDDGADQAPPATVYWPARQHMFIGGNVLRPSVVFTLRTDRTGTQSLVQAIREAVARVAPDIPTAQVRSLAEVQSASMARTSFSLVLLAIAGAMSLTISVVGIYGVLAYAVMQRQREVGVRLALGAAPRAVTKMFVYRGMILSGVGIALGAVAAAGLTQLMSSLLFGVTPVDFATFVTAAGVLAMAALAATYIPARRAAAVDPLETLRAE
jgi:putative ABC transport system permease protein